MNTKIKELTENIYNEGVAKARKEADVILAQARAEAEKTVADAREKARMMLEEAQTEAQQMNAALKAELQSVSEQVIEITRQKVNHLVTAKTSKTIARQLTGDPVFVKDMVLEIARNWGPGNGQETRVEALVPEEMLDKLDPLFKAVASEVAASNLVIKPVPQLKQGFQLVNEADGYKISFTEEDFKTFFASLMRPKIREFLFNSQS